MMETIYEETKKRKRDEEEEEDEENEEEPTDIDDEDEPTDIDENEDEYKYISDVESVYESEPEPEPEPEPEDNLSSQQEYKKIKNTNSSFNSSILTITTHGNILLDDNKNYIFTTIPDGMKVIKISISAPGVVHCSDNKNLNRHLVEIIKSIPSLLDENLNENVLTNLVNRILNYVEKHTVSQVIEKKMSGHLYKKYAKHYSQGFKIHELLPGDKIADKIYWRIYGDKSTNKNEFILAKMDSEIDIHKISNTKYKIPKLPDLFDEFYTKKTYNNNFKQVVNLTKILNYYKNKGTSRLILFDFSCSVFENASFYDTYGEGLQEIVNKNAHIISGGKSRKRKSCKRKSCKRKSRKRKSRKRKSCKRKSCKRKK